MPDKRFKKRIEDFTCEHCGTEVVGNGFTNHCPQCLWSKHVDVHPGDRAEACSGLMRPTAIEGTIDHFRLVHRCEKCDRIRRIDMATNDDTSAMLAVARARE